MGVVFTETATRGVLYKKVCLEISQNSQENTCARVSFLIKLQFNKVVYSISFATGLIVILGYLWTRHIYCQKKVKIPSENNAFIVKTFIFSRIFVEQIEYITYLALSWSYKNWLIKSLCHSKQHRHLESVPFCHRLYPPL